MKFNPASSAGNRYLDFHRELCLGGHVDPATIGLHNGGGSPHATLVAQVVKDCTQISKLNRDVQFAKLCKWA